MTLHEHSTKKEFADYAQAAFSMGLRVVLLDAKTYRRAVFIFGKNPKVVGVGFKKKENG